MDVDNSLSCFLLKMLVANLFPDHLFQNSLTIGGILRTRWRVNVYLGTSSYVATYKMKKLGNARSALISDSAVWYLILKVFMIASGRFPVPSTYPLDFGPNGVQTE